MKDEDNARVRGYFRVNFRRIPLYNGVNQIQGYGPIAIHTPPDVILDEEDEEEL